jgi:nucleotide-binding universal stress UspA family protein
VTSDDREVTVLVLAVIAAWVAVGAVAVLVMRRRGHDVFAWAILFLVLGPLAIPLALSADRDRPVESESGFRPGALDVLVAFDGSPAASAALSALLELFAEQMTSLMLAAVVDIEAATTVRGHETERDMRERLDAAKGGLHRFPAGHAETIVLHGDPAHVLAKFAAEHEYELIVVGCSGPGGARVLRGSVARRLAAGTSVPVLVGPAVR